MGFDWPASPIWLALGGLALVTATCLHFSRLNQAAPVSTRRIVVALRTVALFLLGFLLLRPFWETESPDADKFRLVVLADLSGSMLTKDAAGGPSRIAKVKPFLDAGADEGWLSNLRGRYGKVEALGFEEESGSLRPAAWSRPELGRATALGQSLREGLSRGGPEEPLGGVVLFSDGRGNRGVSALEVAKEYRALGVPVNVVGVGEARAVGDLSVSFAERRVQAVAKEDVEIAAVLKNRFDESIRTTVRLAGEGETLRERQVTLQPGEERRVNFSPIKPEVAGPLRLRLSATPPPGDRDPSNDTDSLLVPVLPPEVVTALYVSNRVLPLYPFLKRSLAGDDRFDFRALVRLSEKTFHAFGEEVKAEYPQDPDFWMDFDAVVLDASVLPDLNASVVDGLKRFVRRRGGGLLLFGPAEVARERLAGIAPAREVEEVFAKEDRSLLAREEPIFTPEDEVDKMKPFLPGRLPGYFVTKKNPAAREVVVSRADGKAVLVLQAYGAGRVGYWGSPHDWRRPLRDEKGGKEFRKFWTALTEWLGSGGEERLRMEDENRARERGKPADLKVEALGSDFEPAGDALVEARVEGPEGYDKTIHLYPAGAVAGRYGASFQPGFPGEYKVTYRLSFPDGESLEHEQFVRVAETGEEALDVSYNERDLRMLAKLTGGEYLKIDDLSHDWEPARAEELPSRVERISLANNWFFFLILFLVAGLEWVFRRQSGLR